MSTDRAWELSALCRDVDPEIFLPPSTNGVAIDWSEARDVCRHCEVKAECLAATPADDRYTMRGGLTPQERAAGRPKPPTTPVPIVHGTATGARLHYRRGTKPCEACRAAARLDKKAREEQAARKATA